MLIRANTDGTYSANWTPGAVGLYTIHVTIDGIEIGMSVCLPRAFAQPDVSKQEGTVTNSSVLDAGLEVEVKDPPKGMIPPGTQMVKPKAEPQPSKVSTFFS